MALIHIKMACLMNSFTIPHQLKSQHTLQLYVKPAEAVKMTVDWMFQGQGDLLHSILIPVSTYISAHLMYLAIWPVKFHTWYSDIYWPGYIVIHVYSIESVNNKYAGNPNHLAHQGLANVKAAMGQIFSGYAALSPFLTQLTIRSRKQIAAQWQHKQQKMAPNCTNVNAVNFWWSCTEAMTNALAGWTYF